MRPSDIVRQRNFLNEMLADDGGTIIDRWVMISEPVTVPVIKRPMGNTHAAALTLLRELIAHYSKDTDLTVLSLTWNHQLWADCGREAITIADAA